MLSSPRPYVSCTCSSKLQARCTLAIDVCYMQESDRITHLTFVYGFYLLCLASPRRPARTHHPAATIYPASVCHPAPPRYPIPTRHPALARHRSSSCLTSSSCPTSMTQLLPAIRPARYPIPTPHPAPARDPAPA